MIRKAWFAAVAAAGLSLAGVSVASASQAVTPAITPVPGSVPAFVAHTAATGLVAGSQKLTVQLWLKPDVSAAQSFASEVSTPGNAQFRHYLSPAAYTARFGPAASTVGAVESWLRSQGFSGIGADPQRSYVRATGPVSTIDAAFGIQEKMYPATATANAGPYQLRANSTAVSLPSSLASLILGVTGLDNQAPSVPLARPGARTGQARITADGVIAAGSPAAAPPASAPAGCSQFYAQNQQSGLPPMLGTSTFPTDVCGYDAAQIRAAYGATGSGGAGQTVAFVEMGLSQDMFLTLQDYAAANSMPAPASSQYSELAVGGDGSSCGDPFDGEEQLDVEAGYDMAPAAHELVVSGNPCDQGDFGEQALYDAETAILDGSGGKPLASIVSNSWGDIGTGEVSQLATMTNAFLVHAAAEGVGMYFASGDESGPSSPSSDPYATAVGGTTLALGKTDSRLFETGWSDDVSELNSNAWTTIGESGASGGGPSVLWAEPAYQHRVVPPALTAAPGNRGGASRSEPDISAVADPFTGFAEGQLSFSTTDPAAPPTYSQADTGGTSLATPLIAGLVADAQQGLRAPLGFINPVLYKLAGTSAISDVLPVGSGTPLEFRAVYCPAADCNGIQALAQFDDQEPSMPGYTGQVTLKGYDNMTGVGTPNGAAFIAALRRMG